MPNPSELARQEQDAEPENDPTGFEDYSDIALADELRRTFRAPAIEEAARRLDEYDG